MLLREQMEATGEVLFRWRSYLPAFLVAIIAGALCEVQYFGGSRLLQDLWLWVCFAISCVGIVLRGIVVGYAAPGTSGGNTRRQLAHALNTTGMYSVVRHPLYLGNFLIWLGIALAPGRWWLPILFSALFSVYYERIALAEEAFLLASFGDDFHAWAARTPACFPRWRAWQPASRKFQFSAVLRREYPTLLGISIAYPSIDVATHWRVEERMTSELPWLALLLVGASTAVTIRFVKKNTNMLKPHP